MSTEGLLAYESDRLPAFTNNTYYNRKNVLKYWITFAESTGLDLDNVDHQDVIDWLVWLRDERGHAHSSIAQNLLELKSVYNWIDRNEYGESPMDKLVKKEHYDWLKPTPEKVKESAEGVTYVTKPEYQLLLEAADGMRERIIIATLAELGLRRQELSWLKLDAFDWSSGVVQIRTAKREEYIQLPGFFSDEYRMVAKKWVNGDRAGWAAGCGGSDYLVTGHKIPSIRTGETTEIVRDAADRAGIQSYREDAQGRYWATITPHALRHSYGVWRAKAGMPLTQISKLMRHTDISVTYDYYQNFSTQDLKDEYDKYQP
ncbi:tyrosine-type recombinase/integrase [Halorubrum sp. DTA46]|uniref:tyrosine-type recombinase/integrase n=1 Tax=Halorubrum sp. DTA46 TaxID=3402162 RepID=UPI003AAE4EBF